MTVPLNETNTDHEEICHCSGTTAAQIKAYADKGVTHLEAVSRATGACSGCGSCEEAVMALLLPYQARLRGDRQG